MAILHIHRESLLLLEECRIYVKDNRVVYAQKAGALLRSWNIPSLNLSCIILGMGTSITTAAIKLLIQDRVNIVFSGSCGTPVFTWAMSDYRPTKLIQKWIRFWPNENARLEVAKFLALERCNMIYRIKDHKLLDNDLIKNIDYSDAIYNFKRGINQSISIQELTGYEGNFAKNLYKMAAEHSQIPWIGRELDKDRKSKQDINILIDDGNYMIYGLSNLVINLTGLTPTLPVTHGETRAGGLVFDLADTVKDMFSMMSAFDFLSKNKTGSYEFKKDVTNRIDNLGIIKYLFETIHTATDIGLKHIYTDEDIKKFEMEDNLLHNNSNEELEIIKICR